jgi:hypothetical protein
MTNEGTRPAGTTGPASQPTHGQGGVVDELRGATNDVSRDAQAAGQTLRQEASGLAGTIKQGLSEQAARQKNGIADRLNAVAERANRTAGDLRQDEPWLSNLLGRGADELAGMAEELRRQDIGDLMGSVELFARRQPALFMGATVALGFALTRVVGAGAVSTDRDQDRYRRDLPTRYGSEAYNRAGTSGSEPRRDLGQVTRPPQVAQSTQVAQPTPASSVSGSNI